MKATIEVTQTLELHLEAGEYIMDKNYGWNLPRWEPCPINHARNKDDLLICNCDRPVWREVWVD